MKCEIKGGGRAGLPAETPTERAGGPGSRNGGQAGSPGAWLETRDCPGRGTERGGRRLSRAGDAAAQVPLVSARMGPRGPSAPTPATRPGLPPSAFRGGTRNPTSGRGPGLSLPAWPWVEQRTGSEIPRPGPVSRVGGLRWGESRGLEPKDTGWRIYPGPEDALRVELPGPEEGTLDNGRAGDRASRLALQQARWRVDGRKDFWMGPRAAVTNTLVRFKEGSWRFSQVWGSRFYSEELILGWGGGLGFWKAEGSK